MESTAGSKAHVANTRKVCRWLFLSLLTVCACALVITYLWSSESTVFFKFSYLNGQINIPSFHNSSQYNGSHFIYNVYRGTDWLKVNHEKEIYLYSAYYDDRPDLTEHQVRVISVTEKLMENRAMYCVFGYDTTNVTVLSDRLAFLPIGAGVSARGTFFREYVISCRYPTNARWPNYVSITEDKNVKNTRDFIPVQFPVKPSKRLPFGVCMKSLYGKQDPFNIVEWMELHRILGTGEVTIYNQSIDATSASARVIRHYAEEGFVDFRQCPNPFPVEGPEYEQISMSPSLDDCMYRNLYRYNKIQVTDIDEIVVPGRGRRNYTDLLRAIDQTQGVVHESPSYVFRNAYFFTDIPGDNKDAPPYLITAQHTRRVEVSPPGYSVKSINDPRVCITLHNHECWTAIRKLDKRDWKVGVSPELGKSHHYKKCHFDAYLGKPGTCKQLFTEAVVDENTEPFQSELAKRVQEKLKLLKLL